MIDTPATDAPAANPFDSELALRHSRYFATKAGRPVLQSDPKSPPCLFASAAVAAFRGFVQNPQFSCVGAKSAVAQESARLGVYGHIGSPEATAGLARDLWSFTREPDSAENEFVTFIALFKEPTELDEAGFEEHLWEQLRQLNSLDAPLYAWDPTVSPDPNDPHFGFSFAGTAFFVVGLHPHSSREARRFPWPLLVFNPHAQFVRLKEAGQWDRMQEVIRTRELSLQGSLNPNLAAHGSVTEARQYSGRPVEPDWQPPFEAEAPGPAAASCPFAHRPAEEPS